MMDQLTLYDGKEPPFQQAIIRSIVKHQAWNVEDLIPRNDAFAKTLNCTSSSATKEGAAEQLRCMRAVDAEDIRLAELDFYWTSDMPA